MGSESEKCVDELLAKARQADELDRTLEIKSTAEQVDEARALVRETQTYIDNHKSIVPSFILKQISEALRKLERHINSSSKSKLAFKFKAKSGEENLSSKSISKVATNANSPEPKSNNDRLIAQNFFGFQNRSGESLCLGPEEVEMKDVSLVGLNNCTVLISGSANTVYIQKLSNTSIIICLACRAITVRECSNCSFSLVCQQLRIDATVNCAFSIFTSARSMLEASRDLTFSELKLVGDSDDGGADLGALKLSRQQVQELMARAGFNIGQNNWRSIDDFDWLSPDVPSKNYSLK